MPSDTITLQSPASKKTGESVIGVANGDSVKGTGTHSYDSCHQIISSNSEPQCILTKDTQINLISSPRRMDQFLLTIFPRQRPINHGLMAVERVDDPLPA